jgi:hypothetical protein
VALGSAGSVVSAALLRGGATVGALLLLAAAAWLGYVSAIAFRRSEGVFMPAGYVSLACLLGGVILLRLAFRS